MNKSLNIDEKKYRHAKFLQTLTLNELETKIVPLFLRLNQNLSSSDDKVLTIEGNPFKNRKVAVEF
jgi:hypothetical protein